MAATPNPTEELVALGSRVTELEKALKEVLRREVTLARRVVNLEKSVKNLDNANARLRSSVSQVSQQKPKG